MKILEEPREGSVTRVQGVRGGGRWAEVRAVGTGQMVQGLVDSDMEFRFYFKCNIKPLEDLKQERHMA